MALMNRPSRSELNRPRPRPVSPCPLVSTNRRIEPRTGQHVLRGPGTYQLELGGALVAGANETIDLSYSVNRASSGRGRVGTYRATVNGKAVGVPVVAKDTGATVSAVQGLASFKVAPGDSIALQVTVQPGGFESVGGGTLAVTATREQGECGKPAFKE